MAGLVPGRLQGHPPPHFLRKPPLSSNFNTHVIVCIQIPAAYAVGGASIRTRPLGRGLDNDKAPCRSHGRGRFWSSMDASIKTSASTMTKPGYRHMGRLGVGGCVHPRPSHDNDKPGLCTAGWTLVQQMILPLHGRLDPRRIDTL